MLRYHVNMGRPKEHDDQTATALLDAAERSIEDQSIDALSVRGVAAEVGVSTRAVYSVYGSKEGLIAALGIRAFDLLGAAVEELPSTTDPISDLIAAGLQFRAFALAHPSLFAIGVQRSAPLPEQLWNRVRAAADRSLAVLEKRLVRMESAGLIGDRSVRVAAIEFHALCEGMAALELRHRITSDAMTTQQLWVNGLSALLHGLRST